MRGDAQVTLKWRIATNDGGSPIVKYQYKIKRDGESWLSWKDIPNSAAGGVTSHRVVADLTNGFSYSFLMRAVTNGGPDGSRLYSPGEMAFVSGIMLESLLFQQKVASGGAHSCALESPSSVEGSRVLCWGSRTYGQLGQGQIISDTLKSPFNFATLVLSESSSDNLYLEGITQVVAGREHSCVLSSNGEVFCWGRGALGQLGQGNLPESTNPNMKNSSIPLAVVGVGGNGFLTDIQQISAGEVHTCALSNSGEVFCWGSGASHRLGNSEVANSPIPAKVIGEEGAGFLTEVVQISAGGSHTCALKNSGQIRCWGSKSSGQLGHGQSGGNSPTPVVVLASGQSVGGGPLENIKQVSAGKSHTCALESTGRVLCWGSGSEGQLGQGTNLISNSSTPVMVVASGEPSGGRSLENIEQISLGMEHTCAKRRSGKLSCWGKGTVGQLTGNTNQITPKKVSAFSNGPELGNVEHVGLGASADHSCILKTDGGFLCWGSGRGGQLGEGTNRLWSHLYPKTVVSPPSVILGKDIGAGGQHTCVIQGNGVNCWGRGFGGQLGNNARVISASPVFASTLGSSEFQEISSGESYSCVLNQAGQVHCWGYGILGDNKGYRISESSVHVSEMPNLIPMPEITQVSVGSEHACAVTIEGKVLCWGKGESGRLGNGAVDDSLLPDYVYNDLVHLNKIKQVSAAEEHTCALRTNGNVFCWGSKVKGRLGSGSGGGYRDKAVQVSNLTTAVQISAGERHTCALKANREVVCWGVESKGHLAVYYNRDSGVPVEPNGSPLIDVRQVSAGGSHTCALKLNGRMLCWGPGDSGQLGNNHVNTRWEPQSVVGVDGSGDLENIRQISAGSNHTCALQENSTIPICWGSGKGGQLGHEEYNDSAYPVRVGSLDADTIRTIPKQSQVAAGDLHTCAIQNDGELYCWGKGGNGRLGIGSTSEKKVATRVKGVDGSGYLTDIVQVSAGEKHTCALKSDGKAYCWGDGDNGRLGRGSNHSDSSTPIVAIANSSYSGELTQISLGSWHTCVLGSDGHVLCWGAGGRGQLGYGNEMSGIGGPLSVEVDVINERLVSIIQISAGHTHTCALKENGEVWCWGDDSNGKLGRGTINVGNPANAAAVKYDSNVVLGGIVQISAGEEHTCALHFDGTGYCWGKKDGGRLTLSGSGSMAYPHHLKKNSSDVFYGMISITAAWGHTCALMEDTRVFCWGVGDHGRLGNGSSENKLFPTLVKSNNQTSLKGVSQISTAMDAHICVTKGSEVKCWGRGGSGRLGNNSSSNHNRPVDVKKDATSVFSLDE